MGYTHYWYTDPILDQDNFMKVVKDFETMIPKLQHLGSLIAGPLGDGLPIINEREIMFNGVENCRHEKRNLGITWPSDKASGVANLTHQHRLGNNYDVGGSWFAGLKLNTRTCGGDCSHETFALEQKTTIPEWQKGKKKLFSCCKTAYKPYDLAVNVCLIIAKHHLGKQIIVLSDGTLEQWADAIQLCDHFLGYGSEFNFEEYVEEEQQPAQNQTTTNNEIKEGDIFYSSWGYDQTNIDYYKVVSVSKTRKTVKIVRIGSKKLADTGFMSEKVEPDPDHIILDTEWIDGQPIKVKKEYRASVRIDRDNKVWLRCCQLSGGYLWVYDGPNIATHYG